MSACIRVGDCLALLRTLEDNSVDAIPTDPPYELGFMGRSWDRTGIAFNLEVWAECLRVLKPGGHLLSFGGTRTYHRIACAIEDAGFDIRDSIGCLSWIYGSGFPKSLNVSKAIDKKAGRSHLREVVHRYTAGGNAGTSTKEKGGTYATGAPTSPPIELAVTRGASPESQAWDGWGTALKPAWEPIVVARKPISGTVVQNVGRWGVGGLNIDACRVATDWNEPDRPESWKRSGHTDKPEAEKIAAPAGNGIECHPGGRWPPNVVFVHHPECRRIGRRTAKRELRQGTGEVDSPIYGKGFQGSRSLGATTETVAAYDCHADCPVRELERQSGVRTSGRMSAGTERKTRTGYSGHMPHQTAQDTIGDTGTAARFFPQFEISEDELFLYCSKAARREREAGLDKRQDGKPANVHPTVKPVALMRWLARLVTPRGGLILDPFAGSGTTGVAAVLEGFSFLGFEQDASYAEIALRRIEYSTPQQTTLFGCA